MVEPELPQAFELLVAGRGRDHRRAGLLGELDRGHADASSSGVDQDRLAFTQVRGREEALLRGAERNWHASRRSCVEPVRNRVDLGAGDRDQLGVRAVRVLADHGDRAVAVVEARVDHDPVALPKAIA